MSSVIDLTSDSPPPPTRSASLHPRPAPATSTSASSSWRASAADDRHGSDGSRAPRAVSGLLLPLPSYHGGRHHGASALPGTELTSAAGSAAPTSVDSGQEDGDEPEFVGMNAASVEQVEAARERRRREQLDRLRRQRAALAAQAAPTSGPSSSRGAMAELVEDSGISIVSENIVPPGPHARSNRNAAAGGRPYAAAAAASRLVDVARRVRLRSHERFWGAAPWGLDLYMGTHFDSLRRDGFLPWDALGVHAGAGPGGARPNPVDEVPLPDKFDPSMTGQTASSARAGFSFGIVEPPVEIEHYDEDRSLVTGPLPQTTAICARCERALVTGASGEARIWALSCGHVIDGRCVDELDGAADARRRHEKSVRAWQKKYGEVAERRAQAQATTAAATRGRQEQATAGDGMGEGGQASAEGSRNAKGKARLVSAPEEDEAEADERKRGEGEGEHNDEFSGDDDDDGDGATDEGSEYHEEVDETPAGKRSRKSRSVRLVRSGQTASEPATKRRRTRRPAAMTSTSMPSSGTLPSRRTRRGRDGVGEARGVRDEPGTQAGEGASEDATEGPTEGPRLASSTPSLPAPPPPRPPRPQEEVSPPPPPPPTMPEVKPRSFVCPVEGCGVRSRVDAGHHNSAVALFL